MRFSAAQRVCSEVFLGWVKKRQFTNFDFMDYKIRDIFIENKVVGECAVRV